MTNSNMISDKNLHSTTTTVFNSQLIDHMYSLIELLALWLCSNSSTQEIAYKIFDYNINNTKFTLYCLYFQFLETPQK